jgi:hypothetical protein
MLFHFLVLYFIYEHICCLPLDEVLGGTDKDLVGQLLNDQCEFLYRLASIDVEL